MDRCREIPPSVFASVVSFGQHWSGRKSRALPKVVWWNSWLVLSSRYSQWHVCARVHVLSLTYQSSLSLSTMVTVHLIADNDNRVYTCCGRHVIAFVLSPPFNLSAVYVSDNSQPLQLCQVTTTSPISSSRSVVRREGDRSTLSPSTHPTNTIPGREK